MRCYYNNGHSMTSVANDYVAQPGEAVFVGEPTDDQLETAFPGYKAAKAGVALQKQLSALETAMHAYVSSRYSLDWKLYLISAYQAPGCSVERKAAIESAWAWADSVVQYYKGLAVKLAGGTPLAEGEADWAAHFDSSDPGVTLLTLPA